jgi:hypothetical protein
MNYPKPPSGSYKAPLIKGLRLIGRDTEANEIERGNMKLGIASTFSGGVTAYPELSEIFIAALLALPTDDVNLYYIEALNNKSVIPASTNGAYVYNPDTQSPPPDVYFAPGELYFKS